METAERGHPDGRRSRSQDKDAHLKTSLDGTLELILENQERPKETHAPEPGSRPGVGKSFLHESPVEVPPEDLVRQKLPQPQRRNESLDLVILPPRLQQNEGHQGQYSQDAAQFDRLVVEARSRLGGLFRPEDYPTSKEIREKFSGAMLAKTKALEWLMLLNV